MSHELDRNTIDDIMDRHGMCSTSADVRGLREAYELGRRAAIEAAALKAASFAGINDMGTPQRIAHAITELLRDTETGSDTK